MLAHSNREGEIPHWTDWRTCSDGTSVCGVGLTMNDAKTDGDRRQAAYEAFLLKPPLEQLGIIIERMHNSDIERAIKLIYKVLEKKG